VKVLKPILKDHPSIFIEGLRKTMINFNQNSEALDLEFHEYAAGVHHSTAKFGGLCFN
jgi:hypothetical protein